MKIFLAIVGIIYIIGIFGCFVLMLDALWDGEYLRALALQSVLIFDVLVDIRKNTKPSILQRAKLV